MAMKNVILFALAGRRYAVELRWVEEVITLGYVTPVPSAPDAVIGVVNRRGSITPVLNVTTLLQATEAAADATNTAGPVRQGDSALLMQVEQMTAAMAVSTVDAVTTLSSEAPGTVLDPRGDTVMLLDPPALMQAAVEATRTARPGPDDAGDAA